MKNFYLELPLDEKRRILEMHSKESKLIKEQTSTLGLGGTGFPNYGTSGELNINPKNLKLGDGGRNHPEQIKDVTNLQNILIAKGFLSLIDNKGNKIKPGFFGKKTQEALNNYYGKASSSKENKTKVSQNQQCIAISKSECDLISSTNTTKIGWNPLETRCSAYMVKCLSEYDEELKGANAWDVFNQVKTKGPIKYNAFTDGSVNWNNIYSELLKNKIGKSLCKLYTAKDDADKTVNSKLPKIISNNVPETSKINLKSLQLGDIVGLYHRNSANKGMAFCSRALGRGLDDVGNIQKDPFTFNSHVGFVGAIKNGVPIIFHNVHGKHTATPATNMMSKNDEDMIVWVVSDNEVQASIKNRAEENQTSQST